MALAARPQRITGLDLRTNFGRDVDQEPGVAVGADRDRLLRARAETRVAAAHALTIGAAAIPLRKAATGRRTEDADLQCEGLPPLELVRERRRRARLRVGTRRRRPPRVAIPVIALIPADLRA